MLHPLPFMARPFVPMATVAVRMIRAVSQVVMVLKLVVPIIFPSRNVWVVKVSCDKWAVDLKVSCDKWAVDLKVSCGKWAVDLEI